MKSLIALFTATLFGATISLLVNSTHQQAEQSNVAQKPAPGNHKETVELKNAIDKLSQRIAQLETNYLETATAENVIEAPINLDQTLLQKPDPVLAELLAENNLDPNLTLADLAGETASSWQARQELETSFSQSALISHASIDHLSCDHNQCDLTLLFEDVHHGVKMEQDLMGLLATSAPSCEFELSPMDIDQAEMSLYRRAIIRC